MPRARPIAIVVSCEHAGNTVPRRYAPLFVAHAPLLASHRGWDPGALAIARAVAGAANAPLISTPITRLLVEPNRSPHHPSLFSAVTRGLPPQERAAILERYYTPHREAVRAAINRALARGRRVLHLGVHTFTPVLGAEVRRADVGLLYDPARPLERRLCEYWARLLRARTPDLRVRRNYPYRGAADGLTTSLRRDLDPDDYLGIELEVSQALAAADDDRTRRETRSVIARSLRSLLRDAPSLLTSRPARAPTASSPRR